MSRTALAIAALLLLVTACTGRSPSAAVAAPEAPPADPPVTGPAPPADPAPAPEDPAPLPDPVDPAPLPEDPAAPPADPAPAPEDPAPPPEPANPGPSPEDPPPPPPAPRPAVLAATLARSLVEAPLVSTCGAPLVDGVLAHGEWDAAVSLRFGAALPASAGGGEVAAVLRALSDDENVYFAIELPLPLDRFHLSTAIDLDADGSGTCSHGDDGFVFSRWAERGFAADPPSFTDFYRWECVVGGAPALCGPADTGALEGFPAPGTNDGGAAFGTGAATTVVELWHPYRGGDPRDLLAAPGDRVPFLLDLRLLDDCADWPRCYGDTMLPRFGQHHRDFVLGCGAPPEDDPVAVRIEVKPGDTLPTLHLSSGGTTAVAVLGAPRFDAAAIDPATVFFAGAPVARRGDGSPQADGGDVDGDGRSDLVLHFDTSALRLTPGDVEATLAGVTAGGRTFRGSDVVRVLP